MIHTDAVLLYLGWDGYRQSALKPRQPSNMYMFTRACGATTDKQKSSNKVVAEALTCVANQMTHNLRYTLTSPVKQHLYPRIESSNIY